MRREEKNKMLMNVRSKKRVVTREISLINNFQIPTDMLSCIRKSFFFQNRTFSPK